MPRERQERELLGVAFDTLPTEVAVLDLDGTILTTSTGWQSLVETTGLHEGAPAVGDCYPESISDQNTQACPNPSDGLRELLAGDREQLRLEYASDETGRERWFSLDANRVYNSGIEYVTVAHTEVTEQKRNERAYLQAYEIIVDGSQEFPDRLDRMLAHLRTTVSKDCALFAWKVRDGYAIESVDWGDETETDDQILSSVETTMDRVVEAGEMRVFEKPVDGPAGSSVVGIPVFVGEVVYGVICCFGTEADSSVLTVWERTFLEHVTRWLSYELERYQYSDKLGAIGEAFPDLGFVIDENGQFLEYLGTQDVVESLEKDPATIVGRELQTVLPDSLASEAMTAVSEAIETGEVATVEHTVDIDGERRYFETRLAPFPDESYRQDAVVSIVRDVTDRERREQELARQRDELAELQRLNSLVREIIQALPATKTRAGIETAVCDHLTDAGLYRGAAVVTEKEHGELSLETATSTQQNLLDVCQLPVTRAFETGELESGTGFVAVPIATGNTEYGVLVLETPPEDGISGSEQELLRDLGEIIALEISRVHSQRSLAADTVLHLELEIPEFDVAGGAPTTDADHRIEIRHRIPTQDGHIYDLGVQTENLDAVIREIESASVVHRCRIVRRVADGSAARLEVHLQTDEQTPFDVLLDHGVSIQQAVLTDGTMEIDAEVHPEVGVRSLVKALQTVAPNTELVRKESIERATPTVTDIYSQATGALTEKQEAALRLAYARGYYNWPRDTTVDELADSMTITASTLHYRLRKAHQAVIDTVLVGAAGPESGD